MKHLKEIWRLLGISIYEGKRLTQNLRTFAVIAALMEIPALSGILIYNHTKYWELSWGCSAFFLANLVIIYLAVFKKNRELLVKCSVIFSLTICTCIIFFAKNGFVVHWTLLFPLVICYLCGVRIGLISSAYLTCLFILLYWTPLNVLNPGGYPPIFMVRFALFYLLNSIIVSYAMIEYHLTILKEIQYEKELEETCEKARAASLAKSDFLASMSHEIRTPLNAVLGINDLITRDTEQALEKFQNNAEIQEFLKKIISHSGNIGNAGNNLLSLINDILDFSKIESGKIELLSENYKLSSILNDVSNMIILRAKSKNLDFHVNVDENLPDNYSGDETRLKEMLQNLLTNAVKYTDKGSVNFSIEKADDKISKSGEFITLKFSVQDTGIGIKSEDISKLFKRFKRLDLNRNSTIEGTGLGLAIVHKLCGMMGGNISVESEYGKGSKFILTIPQKIVSDEAIGNFREKFEQSIQSSEHYHELFRAPDANILIVDDTKFNLLVAVGLLKNTEIKIQTASGGIEGVEKARENNFDLILMDQRMPEVDGSKALELIREFNKTVPIICLTADAVTGAREKYLAQGFTDYLTKPVNGFALEKMLMKHLPPEKIIKAGRDNPKTKKEIENPENNFEILKAAGLDVKTALMYSQNDENFYKILLQEYVSSSDEKIKSLQKYFETGDCENYGIIIHALKSSSKMIGATDFSNECAELEKAAKENNFALIQEKNSSVIEKYKNIISQLRQSDFYSEIPDKENKPEESEEVFEFLPE